MIIASNTIRNPATGRGTAIHELFKPLDGVELELLPRRPMPARPCFD